MVNRYDGEITNINPDGMIVLADDYDIVEAQLMTATQLASQMQRERDSAIAERDALQDAKLRLEAINDNLAEALGEYHIAIADRDVFWKAFSTAQLALAESKDEIKSLRCQLKDTTK